jgi:hypothetical protein
VVGLAVATWAAISRGGGVVAAWKYFFVVLVAMFLALAAVTPREAWAISVRLAMSGWLVTAPWLFAFKEIPAARWVYLISGSLIVVLSMPDLLCRANLRSVQDAGWWRLPDPVRMPLEGHDHGVLPP